MSKFVLVLTINLKSDWFLLTYQISYCKNRNSPKFYSYIKDHISLKLSQLFQVYMEQKQNAFMFILMYASCGVCSSMVGKPCLWNKSICVTTFGTVLFFFKNTKVNNLIHVISRKLRIGKACYIVLGICWLTSKYVCTCNWENYNYA